MASRESDYVRDYLNLYILEKTGNTEGLEVPFQKKLGTADLKTFNEDEASTKESIEAIVQKFLEQEPTKDLLTPEVRASVIDKAFAAINPTTRANFNQMISKHLQSLGKHASTEAFNPNLILSEIFMPDNDFAKDFLDNEPRTSNTKPAEGSIDVSQLIKKEVGEKHTIVKFEREVQALDFSTFNNKKLMAFFELLDSYNLDLDFDTEDLEKTEGLILKLFYSDEQNLNFYVFKKSVRNFMRKYMKQFTNDVEARFKAFDMVKSPHLVLLASFDAALCEFLDKQEYIEKVYEAIDDIPIAHYHLYIKILINLIDNYPIVIDKIISLRVLDRLAGPILQEDTPRNLSLFAVLLTKSAKVHINSKKLLDRPTGKQLFNKIIELVKGYDDLKALAFKNRNHLTDFYPNASEEPQIIIEAYIKRYKSLINQKMPIKRYKYLYYTGLLLLKFVAQCNLRYDVEQKMAFVLSIVDFMSAYFYQRNVVSKGFVSLKRLMCRETVEVVLDAFMESNLLRNCFSVFERKEFSHKTINALLNFQNLLLSIIETSHLAGIILNSRYLKKLLDQIYKIRQIVSGFYYEMKKKYLAKGLVKYVRKLKRDLRTQLVQPLDQVLSLNSLLLQKLSHTQLLDENVLYYTGRSESIFDRFKEKHRMENLISTSNELLYIVSKVDRKENYLEAVISYNLYMLDKIEDFVRGVERGKELVDFDLVESIVEYLIVNIYFVKTYDEHYKKVSSLKVLKRTVELFVQLLESARTFVDLQSNHQIYILLENLGLFWLLFFDYNYRFYDRLSFTFIDNLKTLFRETEDNKAETFTPKTLHKILNFLNDFVDLKSKNPFLNFIIAKQLDMIYLTLTNITPINQNMLVNMLQKILSSEYGPEIHRLHPKYIITINLKTIALAGVKDNFLRFVIKNLLFVNEHAASVLRNLLEKNFDIESLGFADPHTRQLFEHTVLGQPLPATPERTQFLLNLIQRNIRNKVLFEDLVAVLRKYLKTADSTYNNEIVRKLFLSESVFHKLVRLYKKDRVNLSKVLKYLLLICKHFNFLKEIKIPRGVLVSLLNAREVGHFHDVYMLVISYILENDLYEDFKNDIDIFLTNTKKYLDSLLFFSSEINYEKQLRIVYYSLKVLRNCGAALKSIPELATLDSEDFILKYILQLMDENSKLEMVPINNLYHHFKKQQQVVVNYKTANYERKVVMMFFDILQRNQPVFETLIQDFFVVNKLISFSYIVLSEKVFEQFANLFIKILYFGVRDNQRDLFKDVFFDFYLLVYFEFGCESESIEPFVRRHVCENDKLVNSVLPRVLDELKRKKPRFDSMGYNLVIRALLKVYYISCAFGAQIFTKDYLDTLQALDTFLQNNYKDIHAVNKLEKLVVSLYMHIHQKSGVRSKRSAAVFLYIFNNYVDFRLSSFIDRYIYMGLFNLYFKAEKRNVRYVVDKESGEFTKLIDLDQAERLRTENAGCVSDWRKVGEMLAQLRSDRLAVENEAIIIKFLGKLASIDKKKILDLNFVPEILAKNLKHVSEGLQNYFENDEKQLLYLRHRVGLLGLLVARELASTATEASKFINETASLGPLIENIFNDARLQSLLLQKQHFKLALKLQHLLYKLYKLASSKNEAYLKPLLMQYMQNVWLALHGMPEDFAPKQALENYMLLHIIKLMRKRYDEMRIVLFKDFVPSILKIFEDTINRRNQKEAKDKEAEAETEGQEPDGKGNEEQKPVQVEGQEENKVEDEGEANPQQNQEAKVNKSGLQQSKANSQRSNNNADRLILNPNDPLYPFSDENLELLITDMNNYIFLDYFDDMALIEKSLFVFYLISRNKLLLDIEYKKTIFDFIDLHKDALLLSNLSRVLYKLLKIEYFEDAATLNLDASTVKHSTITEQPPQPTQNAPEEQIKKSFLKKSTVEIKEFNDLSAKEKLTTSQKSKVDPNNFPTAVKEPDPENANNENQENTSGKSPGIKAEPSVEDDQKIETPNQKTSQLAKSKASQLIQSKAQTLNQSKQPLLTQSKTPEANQQIQQAIEAEEPVKIDDLSPLKSNPDIINSQNLDNMSRISSSVVVQKKARESSLAVKQKNILYVHKVFATLWKNMEKRDQITQREEEYLSFGLVALQKHLLENLDPEIFNSLSFFALICKFILDERIGTAFKHECLQILRLYLRSCEHKNGVDAEDTKTFLYFYERLFFDNYSEIVPIYFEVLTLIFKFIKFDTEFLNQYIDHMSFCLFEAYSSISANVFVPALALYTRVIIDNQLELDIPKLSTTVYMFLKLNYRDMKLYERALFSQLLAVYDKSGGLDGTKLNNMCLFVKFSQAIEGFERVEEALTCLEEITGFYEEYQKLFRILGFESLYKAAMKKCGDNMVVIRLASRLFLRYTYKADDNKFEMFEVIKFILKYIPRFYHSGNDENSAETVVLLYKSLVNCSLVKDNSDFMVRSDLNRIILEASYKKNNECNFVILSLLFNVCYVFENGEVNLKKLVNDALLNYVSDVFETALEQKNDAMLSEIIDLFIGFVQHEYHDFFTELIIHKIKLALNFYYDSSTVLVKFLTILKDLTVSDDRRVVQLVSTHFDFIYLYHIHYRNFKHEKINFLAKHVIFNCMVHNKTRLTQKELVTYGIPENIIHTFSLNNEKNVIILNLKIIQASLAFEKCQFYVRNHFLVALREILFAKPKQGYEQVYSLCLDILVGLFEAFKDPERINCDFFFDDIPKIFELIERYRENDPYLSVLFQMLKSNFDNNKEKIGEVTQANKMLLQELVASKVKSKSKSLLDAITAICTYVDLHASFAGRKGRGANNAISVDDRQLLESGQPLTVVFKQKLHKSAVIKFNFAKGKFIIFNLPHSDPLTRADKKKLSFKLSSIKSIDQFDTGEENVLEEILKTYFNKKPKRELYLALGLFLGDAKNFVTQNIFLIFENEYKMQKWKLLIESLKQNK